MTWDNSAAKYNTPITIEKRNVGKDALNQPFDNWVLVIATRANARSQTGSAAITAGVETASARVSFRVRQKRDTVIQEGMRILSRGLVYRIESVHHDLERREWTDLVAVTDGTSG